MADKQAPMKKAGTVEDELYSPVDAAGVAPKPVKKTKKVMKKVPKAKTQAGPQPAPQPEGMNPQFLEMMQKMMQGMDIGAIAKNVGQALPQGGSEQEMPDLSNLMSSMLGNGFSDLVSKMQEARGIAPTESATNTETKAKATTDFYAFMTQKAHEIVLDITKRTEDDDKSCPISEAEKTQRMKELDDERKDHAFYSAFNEQFAKMMDHLIAKIADPEKVRLVSLGKLNFINVAEARATRTEPMDRWKKYVGPDFAERLKTCTKENIEYIVEHLNDIELVRMFDLQKDIALLSMNDLGELWKDLHVLQKTCIFTQQVPPGLVTSIQKVAKAMPSSMKQGSDMASILQAAKAVLMDAEVFNSVKELAMETIREQEAQRVPESPAYNQFLNNAYMQDLD